MTPEEMTRAVARLPGFQKDRLKVDEQQWCSSLVFTGHPRLIAPLRKIA
jgi:hypothetical protein